MKNRVRELRVVPADSLLANPLNWRVHSMAQREAFRIVVDEIGFAGAVIAYEDDGELILIDGHMRVEERSGDDIPVLILDVDEDEAKVLLATIDPLGAMATAEEDALSHLLEELRWEAGPELEGFLDTVDRAWQTPDLSVSSNGDLPGDDEPITGPPQADQTEHVTLIFRFGREEYQEKLAEIEEAVTILGVQPFVKGL